MGLESLDREAFTQIRDRLDEIATQVRGDDMPLDESHILDMQKEKQNRNGGNDHEQ